MARRDGADVEFFEPFHQGIHLTGHGGHQAVVEVPAFFFGAAAVAFGPAVRAEVGTEELVAHQQAQAFLEGQQSAGPAGGWGRQQHQAALMAERKRLLLADHPQGRQIGQWRLLARLTGRGRLALAPQLFDQLGAGVGDDQFQAGVGLRQIPQQGNAVGVDVAHHHQQRCVAAGQGFGKHRQKGRAVGHPRGMDQHSRGTITGLEQNTVGGAAPLQGVFQFKAVPLRAQTAQTNDPIVDRQLDRATRGCGAGHAHQ